MKFRIFLLAIASVLLTACNDDDTTIDGNKNITFYVTNYEQSSLDDVAANAPALFAAATSATSLAHLDIAVYDSESHALITSEQKNTGDEDYGSFSVTLPYGNYIVVFLGYAGSRQANLSSVEGIYFADNYVPDLFLTKIDLNISASTTTTKAVTLSRAVAAFRLKSSYDVPADLSKMVVTANGGGHHLNALTGFADEAEERSYTYDVSSFAGTTDLAITVYTFLTSNSSTMTFVASALNGADEEIRSRTFTNVPMKINQKTTYTGSFFTDGLGMSNFNLSLKTDKWNDVSYTY
ncbi:MAG: hypothetical protein J6Y39_04820 [Bacteroidaceae bacterium]|nr:hypothetical protein [Bacteroidaceae bacterium]